MNKHNVCKLVKRFNCQLVFVGTILAINCFKSYFISSKNPFTCCWQHWQKVLGDNSVHSRTQEPNGEKTRNEVSLLTEKEVSLLTANLRTQNPIHTVPQCDSNQGPRHGKIPLHIFTPCREDKEGSFSFRCGRKTQDYYSRENPCS